jgi:CBS-domain-containing membrane protein
VSPRLADRLRRARTGPGSVRVRVAASIAASGALSVAVVGVLAALTHSVLLFPCLGAVAYTMFAHPRSRAARPRNVVVGMWAGTAAGYLAALAFGLANRDLGQLHADWAHVGSAAMAMALTTALMLVTRFEHPPACAAALLVALGVWDGWQLAALAGGVVVLVAIAIAVHRVARLPFPTALPGLRLGHRRGDRR